MLLFRQFWKNEQFVELVLGKRGATGVTDGKNCDIVLQKKRYGQEVKQLTFKLYFENLMNEGEKHWNATVNKMRFTICVNLLFSKCETVNPQNFFTGLMYWKFYWLTIDAFFVSICKRFR